MGDDLPAICNQLLLYYMRLLNKQIGCSPLLEHEPLVAFAPFGVDEMEFACKLFALEDDFKAARLLLGDREGTRVPDSDGAGAVLALGNRALEIDIVDRVVLDHHGETFDPLLGGYSFRDGPAFKNHLARGLIRLEVVGREL